MKKLLQNATALLLALLLLFLLAPATIAENESGEIGDSEIITTEEQPEAFFADDAEISGSNTSDDDGVPDGEPEESPYNSLEALGGAEVFTDTDIIALGELAAGEENEEELEDGVLSEDNTFMGDGEIGASAPKLSLSLSSIHVAKGATAELKITLTGFYGVGKIGVATTDSSLASFRFGKWSGNTLPLYITGTKKGNCNTYVKLYNASNKMLLAIRVPVYVEETPSLTLSPSSLTIRQGSAKNVLATVGGYYGNVYLRGYVNSGNSFSARWVSSKNNTATLTISGNCTGSGIVLVEMRDRTTNKVIKTATISVTVTGTAKISLSTTRVSLNAGSTYAVNVTCSNYDGLFYVNCSTTNGKVASLEWGKTWNGSTIALYLKGLTGGSSTVHLSMKDSYTHKELASATIALAVTQNALIKAPFTSMSLPTETYKDLDFQVSGIGGICYVSWGSNNDQAFSCEAVSMKNSIAKLRVTGKNAGTGKLTVHLLNADKQIVSSAYVTVTVISGKNAKINVDSYQSRIQVGSSVVVPIHVYDLSCNAYLQFDLSDASCCTGSWGERTGSTTQLIINGKATGSGTVVVRLKRASDNKTLSSTQFEVSVDEIALLKQMSYSFANFSLESSLWQSKYMYGDNALAISIDKLGLCDGGNCFGMASTAGLFYTRGNGVNVKDFNDSANLIYDLRQNDQGSFVLSVESFIQCMNLAQRSCPKTFLETPALRTLINNVAYQAGELGRPVLIHIRGTYHNEDTGHAVLAYGVEKVSSNTYRLLISDSNRDDKNQLNVTRYLYIYTDADGTPTSWRYHMWSGLDWGTGDKNAEIGYTNYSSYFSVWQNRGELEVNNGGTLLAVNVDDFNLYDVYGQVVASVVDGELLNDNTDVVPLEQYEALPGAESTENWQVYSIPSDLYTIRKLDTEQEEMSVILSNKNLAVDITTTADELSLCADEASNICSAMLADEGTAEYDITLISSRAGEPETIQYQGEFSDARISLMLDNGNLSTCNTESAVIAVGDPQLEEPEELMATIISTREGGGVLSFMGERKTLKGSNTSYTFIPDEGYVVKDVLVDGESIGACTSYTFDNVQDNHTLHIVFEKQEHSEVCPGLAFADMPDYADWAHTGLDFCISRELFAGTSPFKISPDGAMTRAMLVTVLWRLDGETPAKTANTFTDVPSGQWYTEAISWAAENKLVSGTGNGGFDPTGNVTREQIALFIFNYAKYKQLDTSETADLGSFPDSGKASGWARDALSWANAEGLISGSSVSGITYLAPQGNATRSQVAAILMRYVENIVNAK